MENLMLRELAVLNDGKRRAFAQLLDEVGFGRKTLKLRLKRLRAQSLVMKEKVPSNVRGRPKYAYFLSLRARQQVSSALSDPSMTIVTLPFQSHKGPLQVREERILQTTQK
jgi:predicted ArsR family transcriptional regulator